MAAAAAGSKALFAALMAVVLAAVASAQAEAPAPSPASGAVALSSPVALALCGSLVALLVGSLRH